MLLGNLKLFFIYIKSVNTFTYGFLSPRSKSLEMSVITSFSVRVKLNNKVGMTAKENVKIF